MLLNHIVPIAIGGAIGSVSRILVMHYAQLLTRTSFPIGTMVVNLVGCFLIGMFWTLAERYQLSLFWKYMIISGGLGGFTTFSTFGLDFLYIWQQGEFSQALFYITVSVLGGILAVWLGVTLGDVS